ncbi:MAG: hypothetical protein ABW019_15510 [Chitinophagaceae bacterium]
MGVSLGGVAFKLDTATIDSNKVVHDLFGPDFQPTEGSGDTRRPEYVFVGKTSDLLVILSTDFTTKFFQSTGSGAIQSYLDYFGRPSFVFAFEEYDSGGTYSYSLIYDGVVKRQYSLVSGEETTDFGNPEPTELKWLNLPAETVQVDEETTELVYTDPATGYQYTKDQLPQVILPQLMQEKLGFISWDLHEKLTEKTLYKQASPPPASAATGKKPWWKVW